MKDALKLRIVGMRSAIKYLTRESGKTAKLQAQGYLKALEDIEKVIEDEAGQPELVARMEGKSALWKFAEAASKTVKSWPRSRQTTLDLNPPRNYFGAGKDDK